jgi:hypothetical protein
MPQVNRSTEPRSVFESSPRYRFSIDAVLGIFSDVGFIDDSSASKRSEREAVFVS